MRKLSKTGLIVVFSFLLIIVCVISSVIGVRTVNNVKEVNAELVKNNETLKVENETFRNKITELEKEILILKEQTTAVEEKTEPENKETTNTYVVVSETGINVRESNNTESKIIKMLDKNEIFEGVELKNEDESVWVKTKDGFICLQTSSGYILAQKK